MQRAIRKQGDDLGPTYTRRTAFVDFGPDMARQEHAAETDINVILRRFNVGGGDVQVRAPKNGEIDYTLDMQLTLNAIRDATDAYSLLPERLRKQYPTLPQFIKAVEAGKVKRSDVRPEKTPAAAPAAPAPAAAEPPRGDPPRDPEPKK